MRHSNALYYGVYQILFWISGGRQGDSGVAAHIIFAVLRMACAIYNLVW